MDAGWENDGVEIDMDTSEDVIFYCCRSIKEG